MNEQTASASETAATIRTATGRVVSNRMDKTITVLVERQVQHPLYKKYIRRSRRFHAHDASNECEIGDLVLLEECRPLSKSKTWKLVRILERQA